MRDQPAGSLRPKALFKLLILVAALTFVGAGCKSAKEVTVAPTPETQPAAPAPAPQPKMEPLKLVYAIKNVFGPQTTAEVTLWLEEAQKCDGRDAYLGLMKMRPPGAGGDLYAKIAVYQDTGEIAVSRFNGEDQLAFDDATAEYNSLVIALPVNSVFAAAGKNFNDDANWNATTPILLKGVDSGQEVADYSIIRQEERTDATLAAPCRNFKIIEKGTSTNASFIGCLSRDIGQTKLPFVVAFGFVGGDGNSPAWDLKSFASEKSGLAWVPQCLKVVKCTAPKPMPDSERRACSGQGGEINQVNDDAGCTKEYKCMSQEDLAEQAIGRTQRPGCAVNPTVKQKMVRCRQQNKPNFDTTQYDNDGCLLDIVCRP